MNDLNLVALRLSRPMGTIFAEVVAHPRRSCRTPFAEFVAPLPQITNQLISVSLLAVSSWVIAGDSPWGMDPSGPKGC